MGSLVAGHVDQVEGGLRHGERGLLDLARPAREREDAAMVVGIAREIQDGDPRLPGGDGELLADLGPPAFAEVGHRFDDHEMIQTERHEDTKRN
jgi:hypothetical protein